MLLQGAASRGTEFELGSVCSEGDALIRRLEALELDQEGVVRLSRMRGVIQRSVSISILTRSTRSCWGAQRRREFGSEGLEAPRLTLRLSLRAKGVDREYLGCVTNLRLPPV